MMLVTNLLVGGLKHAVGHPPRIPQAVRHDRPAQQAHVRLYGQFCAPPGASDVE